MPGWPYLGVICLTDLDGETIHNIEIFSSLKVVSNEKGKGLGGRLLSEDGFRPWRSMSVCFLIFLSSFLQRVSISVL